MLVPFFLYNKYMPVTGEFHSANHIPQIQDAISQLHAHKAALKNRVTTGDWNKEKFSVSDLLSYGDRIDRTIEQHTNLLNLKQSGEWDKWRSDIKALPEVTGAPGSDEWRQQVSGNKAVHERHNILKFPASAQQEITLDRPSDHGKAALNLASSIGQDVKSLFR